ncbi:uncharacterized protein LOC127285928 [Leptopilina boulardi]|uniref:uncharacterized protein LOC127285928 n=1 Tax=Leptopilina boulardi TaxID=63433 RepID=UPI0021F62E7E|nr:uncharacterized protein LOC127285928 [Leptopilina boulardi]
MFAIIFRGVFLVGILGLYSTNVWKMIDGFFKDRFQNYLHEEFKKNPKMRDDLNAYAALKADKRENEFINAKNLLTAPNEEQRQTAETHLTGPRSVDVLTTAAAASFLENVDHETNEPRENRVTASVDNNAFQESHEMQAMRNAMPIKSTGNHGFQDYSPLVQRKEKMEKQREKNGRDASLHDLRNERDKRETRIKGTMKNKRVTKDKRENKENREKRSIQESESNKRESKKRKYTPITFTENDFKFAKKSVKIDDDENDDFSEFDLDEEITKIESEHREGILVSELPFKPRFDIGDLEIVTADEFCPLTLEDEATCGITSKWP